MSDVSLVREEPEELPPQPVSSRPPNRPPPSPPGMIPPAPQPISSQPPNRPPPSPPGLAPKAPPRPTSPLPPSPTAPTSSTGSSKPPDRAPPPIPAQYFYGPQTAPVDVRGDNPLKNKTKHVIGISDRAKAGSRRESEDVLSQSPADAAIRIRDTLAGGRQALKAFEIVSFTIAGQNPAELAHEYQLATGGRTLRGDLATAFSGAPGPKAYEYLQDCLAHDGMPSLRARMWILLGLVDSSGTIARGMARIPKLGDKIGNAGDVDRVLELFEAAPQTERAAVWNDSELNSAIRKLDKKIHNRIRLLMEVTEKEAELEAAPDFNKPAARHALALVRDEQLGAMVEQYLKTIPASGKIVSAVSGINKLAQKLGAKGIGEQTWHIIGFKSKDFYDDLVDWRSTASSEDVAQIQQPTSRFRRAMAKMPANPLLGLTASERRFIDDLIGTPDPTTGDLEVEGGEQTQTEAVKLSLERQKQFVERGEGRGAWLVSQLKLKVGKRKWRDLAAEIKLLSAEQRKAMLDSYSTDVNTALGILERDLQAAGFDKETRTQIRAQFNTQFGSIGARYAELKRLVDPGKTSKVKTFLGHLKPTKWSKLGTAVSGTAKGKQARKVIAELEDNEYVLVRQDTALLADIRGCSDDDTWQEILTLLGMKDESDQLAEGPAREMIHEARLAGEANPDRWALLLADAIEEEKVLKGVSAGRDKAQLYNLADKARAAARLRAEADGTTPVDFLRECLDKLKAGERGQERYDYLQKRVPQVFAAFHDDTPIAVEDRMARAKHEGFGIGKLRKVDRQKVEWSFHDLSGTELLEQWSNIDEFRALRSGKVAAEQKIAAATQTLSQPGGDPADQQRAASDLEQYTTMLSGIYGKLHTFTIGIKESRRAEFKKIGVKAEDRIKFEAMVSDRLIEAMSKDTEVQAVLDEIDLPFDSFMKAKMKGIDALEMQRHLDTTRQWHLFSTKTSELSEGTRNVKGAALSTEQRLGEARRSNTSKEDIAKLRKEGGTKTQEAVEDRDLLEARFRDMQATFAERAQLLFKLLVAAVVTGLTMGAGAPLSIFLHIGLEAGFNVLNTMYRAFVLGETDIADLAWGLAIGVLDSTVRILTANLTAGLTASVLAPAAGTPGPMDWVAPALSKGVNKLVGDMIMFAPKHAVERGLHARALEKVLKDGEGDMGSEALSLLGKDVAGIGKKLLLAGVKQMKGPIMGAEPKPNPTPKTFDKAMNDRMAGGGTTQEQEAMWGKYEKKKQRAVKAGAKKVVLGGKTPLTDKAEESRRKDALKEARGKTDGAPATKIVGDATKLRDDRTTLRALRGTPLLQWFADQGLGIAELRVLSDKDKESIETDLAMSPGELDRQLVLTPVAEQWLTALVPSVGAYGPTTVKDVVATGLDPDALLRVPRVEVVHVALSIGVPVDTLVADVKRSAAEQFRARTQQRGGSAPPNRPPPGRPPPKRPPPPPPRARATV
jgi:hypothetical protein